MSENKPDRIRKAWWGHDALQVLAAAAVLYGLAQWSPPAAWVVGGLAVLLASLLGQARS